MAKLLFWLLLSAAALAQTSPAYKKDALALLKLQDQVVASEQAGKNKQARTIQRLESIRLLKFTKKYQSYRPSSGLPPASNALLGSMDSALHLLVTEKDAGRRKQMTGEARKALADLRRFIGQGK